MTVQLTIHRGTHEIGGNCVEIATDSTRIILDVGMPLFDADRKQFDDRELRGKSVDELLKEKTLPNVQGLFAGGPAPDPDKRPARIPRAAGFRGILRLEFHDAVPVLDFTLPPNIVLMNEDHARATWRFVLKWRDEVEAFVVHCEQGMSRSPAVAAAICNVLDGDSRQFFHEYLPNRYVYNMLVAAAEEVTKEI